MKWIVSVGLRLNIDYHNIEADSREEANSIKLFVFCPECDKIIVIEE